MYDKRVISINRFFLIPFFLMILTSCSIRDFVLDHWASISGKSISSKGELKNASPGDIPPRTGEASCWFEYMEFHRQKKIMPAVDFSLDLSRERIEKHQVEASDGVILRGYKISSYLDHFPKPHGYILFAQGKASLAQKMIYILEKLSEKGFDVYVFDYRGCGESEGESLFLDIFWDYREIIAHLNEQNYQGRFLYGISMGGLVLLNATYNSVEYDAIVIDSTPSEMYLSCSNNFHPYQKLPLDKSRLMCISGMKDEVVPMEEMNLLFAEAKGAHLLRHPVLGHPFLDGSPTYIIRIPKIVEFLMSKINKR